MVKSVAYLIFLMYLHQEIVNVEGLGEPCNLSATTVCLNSCANPGNVADCPDGLSCCELPSDLGGVCDISLTETGNCVTIGLCDTPVVDNTCAGRGCCQDLPDAGETCFNTPSFVCSHTDNCKGNGIPVPICSDGLRCCSVIDLPGENEQCGIESSDDGQCVQDGSCDGMVLPGVLCTSGLSCCVPNPGENEQCAIDRTDDGLCVPDGSCNGMVLAGELCSSGLSCCVDTTGQECGRGGTCQSECPAQSVDDQGNCGSLSCCVPGLNDDCSYTFKGKFYNGTCVFKEDCASSDSSSSSCSDDSDGKCDNEDLTCCLQ